MNSDKPNQTVTPDEPSQAIPTDKPVHPEPTDLPLQARPAQPISSDASVPTSPHRVRDISSASELEAALKTVTGPVVVDFVQEGCGACSPAELEELANRCAQTPAAFFRVDVTKDTSLEKLAQDFEVEGTPTTMFAKSAKAWASGAAEEIDPASPAAARKLKCALPKKG